MIQISGKKVFRPLVLFHRPFYSKNALVFADLERHEDSRELMTAQIRMKPDGTVMHVATCNIWEGSHMKSPIGGYPMEVYRMGSSPSAPSDAVLEVITL